MEVRARHTHPALWVMVSSGLCTWGCEGVFGDSKGGSPDDPPADWSSVTPCEVGVESMALRRLTATEYSNSVCDVLGLCDLELSWLGEATKTVFANDATEQTVLPDQVNQYLNTAEAVAAQVTAELDRLTGCAADSGDRSCAETFIDEHADNFYRHRLSDEERAALLDAFDAGQSEEGFVGGMQELVMTMLMDPSTLFLVEMPGDADETGYYRLDDCEIGARLALALWQSAPDDTLVEVCTARELRSPEQIQAQARRMLDDPRAERSMRDFFDQWLDIGSLKYQNERQGVGEFDVEASQALREGMLRTSMRLAFGQEGARVDDLLTSTSAYVNKDTAPLWDFSPSYFDASGEFMWVDMDPQKRMGMLSDPAWAAAHSSLTDVSYVHRGLFIRGHLLCQTYPNPSAEQQSTDVSIDESGSTVIEDPSSRELSELRATDSRCSGCHLPMEPPTWSLPFNHAGRYDESWTETQAEVTGLSNGSANVNGPAELAQAMVESGDFHSCFSEMTLNYSLARPVGNEDACTIESVTQVAGDAGYGLKEWMVAMVSSYAFAHRPAPGADIQSQ